MKKELEKTLEGLRHIRDICENDEGLAESLGLFSFLDEAGRTNTLILEIKEAISKFH